MFIFILISITVVAAAMAAAGIFILLRPVRKTDHPAKRPEDVISIRSVDTDLSEDAPSGRPAGQAVPVSTMECELELADMHEGDIIVSPTEPSPVSGEETTTPIKEVHEEESPTVDSTRSEETPDDVSKSNSEEQEDPDGSVPQRPLELFEEMTY